MSGDILDCASTAPPAEQTVDYAVVGSGCGGATAAWELALAGKDVLVLEEGGDYTGPRLTQRDGAMYDQLYMDRGGRTTTDMSIAVLQGRVLGGGGVINASDVVPMEDWTLRYWQKRFGLSTFSPEALAPFRARALEDLAVNTPLEHQVNRNNQLLREGAAKLGWKGSLMQQNRVNCIGVGTCLIGCPVNAKKNPRFVAIPAALAAGARFYTRAQVDRIDAPTAELKVLRVRRLDAKGYHPGDAFVVKARHVIVAANAIASAQLLLRSGLGNEHVGRHLSLQPQMPITALFEEPVKFHRGIPQSFAVTEFEKDGTDDAPWSGFRIEAIAGTPGIVASLLPEQGAAGKDWMTKYTRLAAALLLMPDEGQGVVRLESSGRLRIDFDFTDELRQRTRTALRAAARLYFAAGAKELYVPSTPPVRLLGEADLPKLDQLPLLPATAPYLSAHQQGSVRFAPDAKDGAANPEGEVYGTKGVYVFDSSGFPSSSSSHTMTPIITVSRFLTRALLAKA